MIGIPVIIILQYAVLMLVYAYSGKYIKRAEYTICRKSPGFSICYCIFMQTVLNCERDCI